MSFSRKHGFTSEPPIAIRNDAPEGLRFAVIDNAKRPELGLGYSEIRDVVCRVLRVAPDRANWSEPNIRDEVTAYVENAEWYKVYDICEALLAKIVRSYEYDYAKYAESMNQAFIDMGIGWQFKPDEGIVYRGEDEFEIEMPRAIEELERTGRDNASTELKEAISDISRRPDPDITGAIQHGVGAVESLCKHIVGDRNGTLGSVIERLPIPTPLDHMLKKMWGFSSQYGRHISEDKSPQRHEAELIVHTCAAICRFLLAQENAESK